VHNQCEVVNVTLHDCVGVDLVTLLKLLELLGSEPVALRVAFLLQSLDLVDLVQLLLS
jgi:hypothetical protein